ncbi:MAG: hypothetical protein SPE54_09820, partial [Sodaliphilus sp.]|nr:hypothetical protein [Sodaliphilus sp.]
QPHPALKQHQIIPSPAPAATTCEGFFHSITTWKNGSADKCWGHRNKKHKKQPFSYASASHKSLVLWHV